jgi:hypothetical protein
LAIAVLAVEQVGAGDRPSGDALQGELELAYAVCTEAAEQSHDADTGLLLPAIGCLCDVATVVVYAVKTAINAEVVEISAVDAANTALTARLVLGVDARGQDDLPAFREAAASIMRDFTALREASERLSWSDGTSVPPSWFGPLDRHTVNGDLNALEE